MKMPLDFWKLSSLFLIFFLDYFADEYQNQLLALLKFDKQSLSNLYKYIFCLYCQAVQGSNDDQFLFQSMWKSM